MWLAAPGGPYQPVAEGDVPVVAVDEDEMQFWFGEGGAHPEHDSEDSNAESFYANSYPDDDPFEVSAG